MGFGLGGLGSLAGSVATGLFNAHEADKNRDFQEDMSNTSYQRMVKDMRAAGINPMLAAKLGGASTPPGATASASFENPATASSAYSLRNAQKDQALAAVKNAEATHEQIKAQTAKTLQETRLTSANADQAEVLKGVYRLSLPLLRRAEDWMNSATSQPTSGGDMIKRAWESLINSASEALPGAESRRKRDEDYKYKHLKFIRDK